MPWTLTTPIQTGGLDSDAYDKIKITKFLQDAVRNMMEVHIEYGREETQGEATVWIPGFAPKTRQTYFRIEGEDYLTLVTTHLPNEGELTYEAVKRALYTWLNTNGHIDAGVIS